MVHPLIVSTDRVIVCGVPREGVLRQEAAVFSYASDWRVTCCSWSSVAGTSYH
jgi:hypothetical protein